LNTSQQSAAAEAERMMLQDVLLKAMAKKITCIDLVPGRGLVVLEIPGRP
jgi:hypothetical protein